jgi:hypothetical protein
MDAVSKDGLFTISTDGFGPVYTCEKSGTNVSPNAATLSAIVVSLMVMLR